MKQQPHVVIIGAGFAGLACAKALGNAPARVTVIDRANYHLFVPLLYQVATAALSPADIARPIRRILGRYKNVDVLLGEVTDIDTAVRRVKTSAGTVGPYDKLVVATGSIYSYFGHPRWMAFARGPRSLEDARAIRTELLTAFERADNAADPAERDRLMTVIVVGGGPTGVEMAGSVAELARYALARDFRHIDPRQARILLIEAAPRLLASFPQSLADYAQKELTRLGVTVMLGRPVETLTAKGATVGGQMIAAATIIWGAGIQAAPGVAMLGVPLDRAGRVAVGPDLSVPNLPGVYVLGDSAVTLDERGEPLPALAQVAAQQGDYIGRALAAQARGKTAPKPFRFHNRGNTAIIGRNAAVFDFGRWHLKGRLAWFLWALVHIYLLVGFENRLQVVAHWLWSYLTYERGARLIMPDAESPKRD
ncbi:MAG TPA: NAD(P)/FAD-dependent oxidoreductase [Pseudolabrys sp.]|jgi:NADH:quinone reductase (non-electrogenic)|nr:NAD(P)/FAD-dependent oxidoreductase [Pseudolabrys sp.]